MNKRDQRYQGKVTLVTGGASGIGEAICYRLAEEGAKVVVMDRNLENTIKVVTEIEKNGGHALAVEADVTNFAQLQTGVEQIISAYGRLDVAVNNAGIGCPFTPTADQEIANWERVIAVNLTGVFLSMKAEIPLMTDNGGAIINMASVSAHVGLAGVSPYVAAKHAVLGLTKSAALEYGKQGVRVTAVCPTFIKTPLTMVELSDDATWEQLDGMHATGRCAAPEDVAAMVAFLGSDEAHMMTGCGYMVDGGYTAP